MGLVGTHDAQESWVYHGLVVCLCLLSVVCSDYHGFSRPSNVYVLIYV